MVCAEALEVSDRALSSQLKTDNRATKCLQAISDYGRRGGRGQAAISPGGPAQIGLLGDDNASRASGPLAPR